MSRQENEFSNNRSSTRMWGHKTKEKKTKKWTVEGIGSNDSQTCQRPIKEIVLCRRRDDSSLEKIRKKTRKENDDQEDQDNQDNQKLKKGHPPNCRLAQLFFSFLECFFIWTFPTHRHTRYKHKHKHKHTGREKKEEEKSNSKLKMISIGMMMDRYCR